MDIDFIAVLTYEQLDNGMFLTSFARGLTGRKKRGIVLHGDSEYTERVIQTGVIREDATIRATKDLNHRLVALLADQGVAAISLNGYQKSLVCIKEQQPVVDTAQLNAFPGQTQILLSNLASHPEKEKPVPVPLTLLAGALQQESGCAITLFSMKEDADIIRQDLPKRFIPFEKPGLSENHLPELFRRYKQEIILTTPTLF